MTYPAYVDHGGIATGYGTPSGIDLAFPGSVDINNILVASVFSKGFQNWGTPAGWTQISANGNHELHYLRADGTETGTVHFPMTTEYNPRWGLMYRFSGCITTGSPFEAYAQGSATSATVSIPSITTLGLERLCVHFGQIRNDVGANNDATYYVEASEDLSTFMSDAEFDLYTYQKATAGVVPADSYTIGASTWHYRHVLALIPVPAGYGHTVIGVAPANIGKVLGVATADISKVIGV